MKPQLLHMIRALLLILLLLPGIPARAQFGGAGSPDYKKIKRATLLVVLHPKDQAYNKLLRKAVTEVWCTNSFAFITEKEFKEKIYNPKYIFLKLIPIYPNATNTAINEEMVTSSTNLSLLQGGKIKSRYKPEDVLASSNMNVYQKSALSANVWRSVTMIHNYVKMLGECSIARGNLQATCLKYNESREKLKGLTLLVPDEDLDKKLERNGKWESLYPHPIRIVDQKEIFDAIVKKRKNIAYSHIYQAGNNYVKCIVRASDSKVLYARHYEKKSDMVTEKFLRELSSR